MSPIRLFGFTELYSRKLKCDRLFKNRKQFLSSSQQATGQTLESPTIERDDETRKRLFGDVTPKIGLEVHAQLKLSSKLFSQGGNSAHAPPNSQLDLFDISLPGTLPKLNKKALKAAILTGLALNCSIKDRIHFDRKNYFYSDMPAGFQITQYTNPIAEGGYIDFIVSTYHSSVIAHSQRYDVVKYLYPENRANARDIEPYIKRSQIERIQLEQDSAKTLNRELEDSGRELYSLVDYNRSGSGLIEIVFKPDLTNHHEASSLVRELVFILKALNTCDCELQEGSLRVDANVSIAKLGDQEIDNSARVELKNLNSLKSLNKGILHEILRQSDVIKSGAEVIQETRTFDTKTCQTVALRLKEESVDYRYVAEPSIPPIRISDELVNEMKENLPAMLPWDKTREFAEKFQIDLEVIAEILEEPGLDDYLLKIIDGRTSDQANTIADFIVYTVSNLKAISVASIKVDFVENSEFMRRLGPKVVRKIVDSMIREEISFATAYEVTKIIFLNNPGKDPLAIVREFDWFQVRDPEKVEKICSRAISMMKNVSKKYKKRGSKKDLYLLLNKIAEVNDDRVSIKVAIDCINRLLDREDKS